MNKNYDINRSMFVYSFLTENFNNTVHYLSFVLGQGGPTSALLWATFQNYSSLRASVG